MDCHTRAGIEDQRLHNTSLNLGWLALKFYPKHFLIPILSLQLSFPAGSHSAPGWDTHVEASTHILRVLWPARLSL